jgi:hypothetical protein
MSKDVDGIAHFLASLHQLIGHRATANFLGQPVEEGEQADCVLCRYEQGQATRAEVVERIGNA